MQSSLILFSSAPQWEQVASAKHCLKTKAPWVLFVQHQQLQGSLGDLDQNKFDPLRLTFVREPTVSEQQHFLVETQFFEKFPCGHKSLVTNPALENGYIDFSKTAVPTNLPTWQRPEISFKNYFIPINASVYVPTGRKNGPRVFYRIQVLKERDHSFACCKCLGQSV